MESWLVSMPDVLEKSGTDQKSEIVDNAVCALIHSCIYLHLFTVASETGSSLEKQLLFGVLGHCPCLWWPPCSTWVLLLTHSGSHQVKKDKLG